MNITDSIYSNLLDTATLRIRMAQAALNGDLKLVSTLLKTYEEMIKEKYCDNCGKER